MLNETTAYTLFPSSAVQQANFLLLNSSHFMVFAEKADDPHSHDTLP